MWGCGSVNVQYVDSNGNVNYNWYNDCKAVRRSETVKCNKVRETPKLESRRQKNKQPFLPSIKGQDKYKGKRYHDRQ